jgi:uncharacterized membrane protein
VLALIILAAADPPLLQPAQGRRALEFPAAAIAILAGVAVWLAPAPRPAGAGTTAPTLADIQPIINARCTACHAEKPT